MVRWIEDICLHNMGALQKETIAHVFEMRSVLTPAQAEVFDDRIVEALAPDEG